MKHGIATDGAERRTQDGHFLDWLFFVAIRIKDKTQPLFSWTEAVAQPGVGLRYCDMLAILKLAAEKCGRDVTKFGTHSLRRGGGCQFLSCGATLEQVTFHGRWAPGSRAPVAYVEEGAGMLLADFQQTLFASGQSARVMERAPPRPRLLRQYEVTRALRAHLHRRT